MIVIFPSRKRKDFLPFWTIYVHLPLILFPSFCFHLISIKALPFEQRLNTCFQCDSKQTSFKTIAIKFSRVFLRRPNPQESRAVRNLGTNKKNGVRTGGILFVS